MRPEVDEKGLRAIPSEEDEQVVFDAERPIGGEVVSHSLPVTRESRPRFDRYAELLVSSLASAALLAAAHRYLVRRHDYEVAPAPPRPTSPRTVDSTSSSASSARSESTPEAAEAIATPADADPDPTPVVTLGVNAAAVARFLGELRTLDGRRAIQIRDGRAMAEAKGYARAHRESLAGAPADRHAEWAFAQEAASSIARGRLGDSPMTERVVEVIAEIAGTIAIGDLIPQHDLEVLVLPWMWRAEPITEGRRLAESVAEGAVVVEAQRAVEEGHTAEIALAPEAARTTEAANADDSATAATVSLASTAAPVTRAVELPAPRADPATAPVSAVRNARTGRRLVPTLTSKPAVFAIVGLVVLLGTVLALSGLSRQQAAGLTDGPSATSPVALAGLPSPTASPAPASFAASPSPTTFPSLAPTPSVAPLAIVRPTPRPTPKPYCTVVNLVGLPTNKAKSTWANAGFTGTVTFSPDIPPHYTITSQNRTAGASIPCTSGISVQGAA